VFVSLLAHQRLNLAHTSVVLHFLVQSVLAGYAAQDRDIVETQQTTAIQPLDANPAMAYAIPMLQPEQGEHADQLLEMLGAQICNAAACLAIAALLRSIVQIPEAVCRVLANATLTPFQMGHLLGIRRLSLDLSRAQSAIRPIFLLVPNPMLLL
jgi:hypothetical protein